MKRKLTILFFTAGPFITEDQKALGQSVGAQFRNAQLVDPDRREDCDYVMGAVPVCYEDKPVYDSEAASEAFKSFSGDTLPPQGENAPQDAPQDASGELNGGTDGDSGTDNQDSGEEITLDYLGGLDKAELLELADEENIGLTASDKKSTDKLRTAIAEHFGLQA